MREAKKYNLFSIYEKGIINLQYGNCKEGLLYGWKRQKFRN